MPRDITPLLDEFPAVDRFDRQLLAAQAIGKPREYVLAHPEYTLTDTEAERLQGYLERRTYHEPIAYILGHKEFYGLDFEVTPATLIPRPETELMVEEAMKLIATRSTEYGTRNTNATQKNLIIDVGTGSGNIIITLATLLEKKNILTDHDLFALDISDDALAVARWNAGRHDASRSINFIHSDLLKNFPDRSGTQTTARASHRNSMPSRRNETPERHDHLLILANLPYLSETIYASSDPDVREHEPITALVSNESGLAHYRRLLEQVRTIFLSQETNRAMIDLLLEISPEQEGLIAPMIHSILPSVETGFIADLSGRSRLVSISC